MRSLGSDPDRLVRWVELDVKDHQRYFGLEWMTFYFQPRRGVNTGVPREERIKIKQSLFTKYGEECWFYKDGDPEMLVRQDDGRFIYACRA